MGSFKNIAQEYFPLTFRVLRKIKRRIICRKLNRKYPGIKLFSPIAKGGRLHYSQENQDAIVLDNFFKGASSGFYCDIGGNDPVKLSNTLLFEELGWEGVAFEPLPHMGALWQVRRKAKLYSCALSDKSGEVQFTVVKDRTGWEDMLSHVSETRNIEGETVSDQILVETRVFRDVAKEENIRVVDFLSLDVEGHEINVLKGIDFQFTKIGVIVVENNPKGQELYGGEEIREFLIGKGFVFWGRIVGLDDIFVNKNFENFC